MRCVILRTFNEKYVTKRTVTILNRELPYQNFLTLTFEINLWRLLSRHGHHNKI